MKSLSRKYVFAILILFFMRAILGEVPILGGIQVERLAMGILTILYLPVFFTLLPEFRRKTSAVWLGIVLFIFLLVFFLHLVLALTAIKPFPENMSFARLFAGSYFYMLVACVFVSAVSLW